MPEKITIDELAVMVQKGFSDIEERFDEMGKQMATKEELRAIEARMNKRFDKLEGLPPGNHERRITKLESDVKEVKEALAM